MAKPLPNCYVQSPKNSPIVLPLGRDDMKTHALKGRAWHIDLASFLHWISFLIVPRLGFI